jgi:hypothetical protein
MDDQVLFGTGVMHITSRELCDGDGGRVDKVAWTGDVGSPPSPRFSLLSIRCFFFVFFELGLATAAVDLSDAVDSWVSNDMTNACAAKSAANLNTIFRRTPRYSCMNVKVWRATPE